MIIFKIVTYVPDRDQNSYTCSLDFHLFYIRNIHHFDTVNNLDMVKTRYLQTPNTCLHSLASFPLLQFFVSSSIYHWYHPIDTLQLIVAILRKATINRAGA